MSHELVRLKIQAPRTWQADKFVCALMFSSAERARELAISSAGIVTVGLLYDARGYVYRMCSILDVEQLLLRFEYIPVSPRDESAAEVVSFALQDQQNRFPESRLLLLRGLDADVEFIFSI